LECTLNLDIFATRTLKPSKCHWDRLYLANWRKQNS